LVEGADDRQTFVLKCSVRTLTACPGPGANCFSAWPVSITRAAYGYETTSFTTEGRPVSKVRVPSAPLYSLECRETRSDPSRNCGKWAEFRDSRPRTGPEISVLLIAVGRVCSLFLRSAPAQSGFDDFIRRMRCDQKPMEERTRLDFANFQCSELHFSLQSWAFHPSVVDDRSTQTSSSTRNPCEPDS
jgi:hypothetical protein